MSDDSKPSSVQVAVRVRPMLSHEAGSTNCIQVLKSSLDLEYTDMVRLGGESGPIFTFDETFDGTTSQDFVYKQRIVPLVNNCLEGYNATVLAYGQTGSGKTHTIMGPSTITTAGGENAGVIPRAIHNIFEKLQDTKEQDKNESEEDPTFDFEVRVQFLELYGEEIRDLLTNKGQKLSIRDIGMDEPEVLGASQHKVDSAGEALLCLTRGMMRRVTASTAMNASSSRSHAILSVMVEQSNTSPDGIVAVKRSKFNFVDLAGSERVKRTKAEGRRLKEGININKGLLVLGNVISALGDRKKQGKTFVPYRDSKLTRLLKGSLGGNHKTLMFACASPSSSNLDESLNCLRYANRAKNIQNNAIVNVDPQTRMVAELKGKLAAMAKELLRVKEGGEGDENQSFSIQNLKIIVGGGEATAGTSLALPPSTPSKSELQGDDRLRITFSQLESTQKALSKTTEELQSTTEELFTERAEKEMYRLRLKANGDDEKIDAALLEKVAEYERQISSLKEGMDREPSHGQSITHQASNILFQEKEQLLHIKAELADLSTPSKTSAPSEDVPHSPEFANLRSQVLQSISHTEQLDAEEKAEQDKVDEITDRFLEDDDDRNDTIDKNENVGEEAVIDNKDEAAIQEPEPVDHRREELETNLLVLSRSIYDKEVLIEQLQVSQKKYANMREFYEGKLSQMEEQVRKREAEREILLTELKKLEAAGDQQKQSKKIQERLREKESQLSNLKLSHRQLVSLTKVSSRNEEQMNRLKTEITDMKKRKVEVQKMIKSERKGHVAELQRLKKEVAKRDRETNKWKKISDRKSAEASKAQKVAKNRLDQMGQLRAKYKDAERKLRVQAVKRGVMAKAGLDNVIVGRRNAIKKLKSKKLAENKTEEVNVDAIRGFLDQKVVDIGRKEALADKLANEWEDHLELSSRKEELVEAKETGRDVSSEELDSIDVQLNFKEDRIRQLAHRLGKYQDETQDNDKNDDKISFLDGKEFETLLSGKFLTFRIHTLKYYSDRICRSEFVDFDKTDFEDSLWYGRSRAKESRGSCPSCFVFG